MKRLIAPVSRHVRAVPRLLALGLLGVSVLGAPPLLGQQADNGQAGSQNASEQDGDEKRGRPQGELPKLEDMELPTVQELLNDPPRDWIILKTEEVIVCEPVAPRPNTLETMQARIEESNDWPRPSSPEEREDQQRRREALHYLDIVLPGDAEAYQLHIKHVEEIRHHEDLLLLRIDELIEDGDLATAFELLFLIARRAPEWPGLAERRHRLVFLQAKTEFEQGKLEMALGRLEDLHRRAADYSGLSELLGTVVDRLIQDAVDAEEYRQARHFLNRLRSLQADHPTVEDWEQRLLAQARELLDEAGRAASEGRHGLAVAVAEEATRVWPHTPGLGAAYRQFVQRFPRLRVGVLRHADDPSPYFLPTAADRRHRRLTRANLFEVDHIDQVVHYRSRFFEQWEPTDLGRRTEFVLRRSRSSWESLPVVSAPSVASSIMARLDPAHPTYNERLAAFVDAVRVESPFEFEVRFARIPLSTEALFRFPVARAEDESGRSGEPASQTGPSFGDDLGSQRFRLHEDAPEERIYRRSVPQPDGLSEYHVAEVVERTYASYDRLLQGLYRGEVSVLPRVRPRDVVELRDDGRFFVQQSTLPVTHVLQFNRASKEVGNRELRRALAHAIDRPRILQNVILNEADAGQGRIVSAPYSRRLESYSTLVEPREHDPLLAVALGVVAQKQLGGTIPPLTMLCAPDPLAEAAAREMIRHWQRIGVSVNLVTDSAASAGTPESENWDLIYRTVQMTDPSYELWPFLTLDPQARTDSLEHLPDWLRQELVELDQASDWKSALRILHRLHRHLQAEVQVIPLWEVDDFIVIRKNISGFPTRPVHPYQGIERWTVESWYSTERP